MVCVTRLNTASSKDTETKGPQEHANEPKQAWREWEGGFQENGLGTAATGGRARKQRRAEQHKAHAVVRANRQQGKATQWRRRPEHAGAGDGLENNGKSEEDSSQPTKNKHGTTNKPRSEFWFGQTMGNKGSQDRLSATPARPSAGATEGKTIRKKTHAPKMAKQHSSGLLLGGDEL